jgi:hypothetical protein
MTAVYSTNAHPVSPITSHALHSKASCLAGVEFNVCSQRNIPISAFNFVTFLIHPDFVRYLPSNVRTAHPLFQHDSFINQLSGQVGSGLI